MTAARACASSGARQSAPGESGRRDCAAKDGAGRRAAQTEPSGDASPGPAAESREDFVRRTAYAYYEARGRSHGHELDDWLQAEAEAEFERIGAAASAGEATTAH